MYQIEDIIRSMNFDMDLINKLIVDGFDQPQEVKDQIYQWYLDLTESLIREGKKGSGHLNSLVSKVEELQGFHSKLLTVYQDNEYQKLYESAKPILRDLVMKSGGKKLINEIDVALNGAYGYLLLKLRRVEISEATIKSIQRVNAMLAYLAHQYKQKEDGRLMIRSNEN